MRARLREATEANRGTEIGRGGFQLLRDLAQIEDKDVRRILRSNLGKSRLAARHAAEVAACLRLIEGGR